MELLVATLVSDGGLWHAGTDYDSAAGTARTLCGRRGWVDHTWEPQTGATEPVAAILEGVPADEGQLVECITCYRALERIGAAWTAEVGG